MGNLFNTVLVQPILNVLVAIYHVLAFLHLPSALGFAIILLTVLIRFILYPLTISQLRTSRKMQKITPHLNRLKEQHKGNPQRLQQETMQLYREHGVNPASGCLLMLIQFPLLWALYAVLQNVIKLKPAEAVAYINKAVYVPSLRLTHAWDPSFFGLPLGQTPSHLLGTLGIAVLLIPVVTGVLQYFQSKQMFVLQPAPAAPAEKKSGENDFSQAMQTQMLYLMPLMIGYFSFVFPLGLSLYWNTFSIFGIIQQYLLQRGETTVVALVPEAPVPVKKKKKK